MRLVIAEKPSVARSIAEVLGATDKKDGYLEGNGYFVSWCVGHLIELASADEYNPEWKKWSYETLPIMPKEWQHKVKEDTEDQYQVLYRLLHSNDVSEVICATDAGREGELIFRLVYHQAECEKPCKRLWISSMEEKAIAEGFEHLREGMDYDNLYQSALCRSKADWLVGINATRLFTVLYRHKLSVGRVQTPTLAMLVEREQKIADFVKEQYFMAHILCNGIDAVSGKITSKERAEQIAGACQNGQALVLSVEQSEKNVNPPKLYDLTTLQREANRLFGYTAKQTLDYTQTLYEKKLVTYPRTDSQFLTDDMEQTAFEVIETVLKYLPFAKEITYEPSVAKVLNSKKVSDHHAIIPTLEVAKVDLATLPKAECNILSLVANKLLCATGEKHTLESVKAMFECQGEVFSATGKAIRQNGWKDIEEQFKKSFQVSEDKNSEKAEKSLPQLENGMTFEDVGAKVTEHYTSPPKHYTEDTLLSAMETAGSEDMNEDVERIGLGTPATRASIIEKLVDKGFVIRKEKQMLPTENGIKLITVLPEVVKSPKLTAEWENDLSLIAKGEKRADGFMEGIEDMVLDLVKTYHEIEEGQETLFSSDREIIGKCPKCGKNVYESKVNFYCEDKECKFSLFKNNRYFASMRKELTKSIAEGLLKNGKTKVTGLYSEKKDKTFSAIIVLDATGEYPQFSMEFEPYKKGKFKGGKKK